MVTSTYGIVLTKDLIFGQGKSRIEVKIWYAIGFKLTSQYKGVIAVITEKMSIWSYLQSKITVFVRLH